MAPISDFEILEKDGSRRIYHTEYPVSALIRCPRCTFVAGFEFESDQAPIEQIKFRQDGGEMGTLDVRDLDQDDVKPVVGCDYCRHLFRVADGIRQEV